MVVKYLSRYNCSLDDLKMMLAALTVTDDWLVRTSPELFAIDSMLNSSLKDCEEKESPNLKQIYRKQSC